MIDDKLKKKFTDLKNIIKKYGSLAIGFSGGVDSTFLLKVAVDTLGKEKVLAVTSCSETYPDHELQEAQQLAEELGGKHKIIYTTELDNEKFAENSKRRCYYCKYELFSDIKKIARDNGYDYVVDGSNYDDKVNDYRPGMEAAAELDVKSPLKEAEMTKEDIRILSKQLELPTWNKASFACLSSRFPYGMEINNDNLQKVDKAETYMRKFNFTQLRVRHHDDNTVRIEVIPGDMKKLLNNRDEVVNFFKKLEYTYITMDMIGYRTGSMNEVLQD